MSWVMSGKGPLEFIMKSPETTVALASPINEATELIQKQIDRKVKQEMLFWLTGNNLPQLDGMSGCSGVGTHGKALAGGKSKKRHKVNIFHFAESHTFEDRCEFVSHKASHYLAL